MSKPRIIPNLKHVLKNVYNDNIGTYKLSKPIYAKHQAFQWVNDPNGNRVKSEWFRNVTYIFVERTAKSWVVHTNSKYDKPITIRNLPWEIQDAIYLDLLSQRDSRTEPIDNSKDNPIIILKDEN